MPGPSASFDCDDGTLLMYERLARVGINSVVIAGNLHLSGEEYKDIDHVWLLADLGGRKIAFDWGMPKFDGQHYEGYHVDRAQLVKWVDNDHSQPEIAAR